MAKYVNTPYDDVFRTLITDGGSLIIPLINETFHEDYTGDEEIILRQNEHYLTKQDGDQDERVSDSNLLIIGKNEIKNYHYECQSGADNSLMIRFFEYDSQIALTNTEFDGNTMTVTFPNSAVLFLRITENTPDELKIVVKFPGTGSDGSYTIPVLKVNNYTIDEIFDKNLLFLIPFYIFSHESRFKKYEENTEQLEKLEEEYSIIRNRLEGLVDAGKLDEYRKCMLVDMTNKVLEHIAVGFEKVKEGVKTIMGGKVLDYEAKTIYNSGKDEGKIEMLVALVKDKLITLAEGARRAGVTEDDFAKKMASVK